MRFILKVIEAIAIIVFSVVLNGCAEDRYLQLDGAVWNTSFHIVYRGPESLKDSVLAVLKDIEMSVSVFNDNSLISRINRNETDSIDESLQVLIEESKRVNAVTDGAFDPTIGPLISAWGFGKIHIAGTDTLKIDSLLNITGIDKIIISNSRIVKENQSLQFNFSAIAKGYGCDCIGKLFERNSISDYMIEIGGEISLSGKSPQGSDWVIGVENPKSDYTRSEEIRIRTTNCGLATSGNYRNYRETEGGRKGHTINPRTGRPIQTDIASATVVGSSAMEADAFATAFMVLGSKRSLQIADSLQIPVFLILTDDEPLSNTLFDKLITD